MHSVVTQEGQTTIPPEVLQRLGVKAGDRLIYDEQEGRIVLRADDPVKAVLGMLRDRITVRATRDFEAEREAAHRQWGMDGLR